jgi:hypothetical protein
VTTTPFHLPEDFHPDYYSEPVTDQDLWDLEVTARGLFHYFQSNWLSGKIQLYDLETAECTDLRVVVRSSLALLPLIEIQNFTIHPTHDLTSLIPELFRNFTISTFKLQPDNTNVTTCTLETTDSIYSYQPLGLLLSYGVATALSIACAYRGLRSLNANGEPTKPNFAQFVTTYNVEQLQLDK